MLINLFLLKLIFITLNKNLRIVNKQKIKVQFNHHRAIWSSFILLYIHSGERPKLDQEQADTLYFPAPSPMTFYKNIKQRKNIYI